MATTAPDSIQGPSLGINDLLKILLTQLTFQDPLKPVDNEAFIAQLAQFSALQQAQDLNTKIDALSATQAALQSVGLLNKQIDFNGTSGLQSGTVTAVALSTGVPLLTVTTAGSGSSVVQGIGLGQIIRVH
jgi:flagellar basal-body rod modification protein FlgD